MITVLKSFFGLFHNLSLNATDRDVNIEARNVGFIGKGKNLVKLPNVVELEPIA